MRILEEKKLEENQMKLIWTVKENDVHLWCRFSDLFKNKFIEYSYPSRCFKENSSHIFYQGTQFVRIKRSDIQLNHRRFDKIDIPQRQKDSILRQINKLEPIDYIKNKVDEFKSKFCNNTVTVSVRSFLDADRNYKSNGKYFELNKVFKKMDQRLNENTFYFNNTKFFVTCDHQDTFEKILKRYGDRIIYTPKRTYFGDYKTLEGIQDCVIDLLLGGHNMEILATRGSSFCDMQWWFGGGKSIIKHIEAHRNL